MVIWNTEMFPDALTESEWTREAENGSNRGPV